MYLLSLNSLCLHSLACIKRFPPVYYPFLQRRFFSRESPKRALPNHPLCNLFSHGSHLPCIGWVTNWWDSGRSTLFLSYALSFSFPCIFCRYYLVLFHCFYPRRIKVFPHPLGKSNMGFLSLPYYILLGWTYWLSTRPLSFHWILLGNICRVLSYSFTFGLFKTHFTLQEGSFYTYALPLS